MTAEELFRAIGTADEEFLEHSERRVKRRSPWRRLAAAAACLCLIAAGSWALHGEHIREVIRLLGGQTGYPQADIGKLFFMETVLANIWRLEDGDEMVREELEAAVAIGSMSLRLTGIEGLPGCSSQNWKKTAPGTA